MSDVSGFFQFTGIWILLLLFFGGLVVIILWGTNKVEEKNDKSGSIGRTIARYSREQEQWASTEAIPAFFHILFWGGIIFLFGILSFVVGKDTAASIIIYGAIAVVVLLVLLPIVVVIWLIISSISSAFGENEKPKPVQKPRPAPAVIKSNIIQTQEVHYETQTQNKYDDYSDDDWD